MYTKKYWISLSPGRNLGRSAGGPLGDQNVVARLPQMASDGLGWHQMASDGIRNSIQLKSISIQFKSIRGNSIQSIKLKTIQAIQVNSSRFE